MQGAVTAGGLTRIEAGKDGRLHPVTVVRGRETTRAGKQGDDDKRKAVLDELAAEAQHHGLGY